ncbi:hypothetical protein SUGI_0505660 [Cryptomeria japonica]|nr:hypothetical protein SUGI_0505660 [Cryptomeria japonica]
MAPPNRRAKLKREELAAVLSVVATVVVIVQQFLIDNDMLLLPSQTMALEASVQATTLALTKLHMMFSLAEAVSHDRNIGDKVGCSSTNISTCWFHRFTSSVTEDKEWRDNFRMTAATFHALLESLRPALDQTGEEQGEMLPIPADYKLGMALYRLAHGATFKSVGQKFGMGASCACKAFDEVCKALNDRLYHLSELPSSPEGLLPIIDSFASMGMPNCCGVIGYTRFLVESPPADHPAEEYRDPEGRYGVIMQGLVDSSGRFLDISVGWKGANTPPNILPHSNLYIRVEESQELLHGRPAELINGVLMPQYIIGDSFCPLYSWLLTPYLADNTLHFLTPRQELYNSVHEYARSAISRAFGMLKSQWQLLTMRQRWEDVELLPSVVNAACLLHNLLINYGEPMPNEQELVANEFFVAQERDEVAESIRDALAAHIYMVAQMRP